MGNSLVELAYSTFAIKTLTFSSHELTRKILFLSRNGEASTNRVPVQASSNNANDNYMCTLYPGHKCACKACELQPFQPITFLHTHFRLAHTTYTTSFRSSHVTTAEGLYVMIETSLENVSKIDSVVQHNRKFVFVDSAKNLCLLLR